MDTSMVRDEQYKEDMDRLLREMERSMVNDNKRGLTVSKYIRDARKYLEFVYMSAGCLDAVFDSEQIAAYREELAARYKQSSANSMIAGVNYYFRSAGRGDVQMKTFRVQRQTFRDDTRDLAMKDYFKLIDAAAEYGKERLMLIMKTLGSTGIRIGELRYITVEAVQEGMAVVRLKEKTRTVLIPGKLRTLLEEYAQEHGIQSGSIFITRTGNPVDRSNVLHDMKKLCARASVDPDKVFPHNFRHLFAVTHYNAEKDLSLLADILGHSDINTTRIYLIRGQADMEKTIEDLGFL